MKYLSTLLCAAVALFTACKSATDPSTATGSDIHIKVNCIWNNGKYCAFTSIVKFHDQYYVTFREGEGHVFNKQGIADGRVRILQSADGEKWESVALLEKEGFDLRDPKLSITPDGRLMVIMGGSVYKEKTCVDSHAHVSFSTDGKSFDAPQPVSIDSTQTSPRGWLWRVTWHGNVGYTVSYYVLPDNDKGQRTRADLLRTTDGIHYEFITELAVNERFPNEGTLRFLSDGTMLLMLRQDGDDLQGIWGTSVAPYTTWTYKKIGTRLGGPDFLTLGDTLVIAGTRMHLLPYKAQTMILTGHVDGTFHAATTLPSAGDTSYPGLLVEGNELWMVYYSQHERQEASIYLARMPLSMFK